MAKYRLAGTEPRTDGSGNIAFDIWGIDDDGLVIPGKHITILVPYDEVQTALNSGNPSGALRTLLIIHKPASGWSNTDLDLIVANNLNAATVDVGVDDHIDLQHGGYPVDFSAGA